MDDTEPALRLALFEGYLREDPQNLALLGEAFEASMVIGLHDHAEFHLRHALALGQNGVDWRRRETTWLMAQKRWDDAIRCLRRLLEQLESNDPNTVVLIHDLAYSHWRRGDSVAALTELSPWLPGETVAASRDHGLLQALWLRLMHHTGRQNEAVEWARKAETAGILNPEGAGVASLAAMDIGDLTACARWVTAALQIDAPCTEARVSIASLLLLKQDPDGARAHLQEALRRQPQDGRTWSAMGLCELQSQRLDAAHEAFTKALAGLPGHVGTWHGLGWTELMRSDLPAARRAFESALSLDRNFGESHGSLAVCLALSGERNMALEAALRALRLDPSSLSARYAQAMLDGQAGDIDLLCRLSAQKGILISQPSRMPSA